MTRTLLAGFLFPLGLFAVDFDRDIRPILSDNCFTCHGPDEKRRMGNLRLDDKDGGAFRVITRGDSAHSALYLRVSATKKGMQMPPSGPLSDKQVALIKQWIDQGAKWETHWAYTAPRHETPPDVAAKEWLRNPVDNFILARLEKEKLKPSPEASKATLLRRVTLDLTGLPPTPAELDSFLSDKSPQAYEKRVDRLLASPRYGEKMAMQWLDLARYADTHGYHIDSHRDMWHWRDWVIQAFNTNKPYDQFTVEQLAGDLMPNATVEQKLATGFNRNHMINFEGGAIPEEYQNEYVVDRVEATTTVWMGMTMGCARCHDHKYDPISQRDFYRFYAFFNTIPEQGLDGKKGNAAPLLQLPSQNQAARLAEVTGSIAAKEKILDEKKIAALLEAWQPKFPTPAHNGLLAHYQFDGGLSDSSGNYHDARFLSGDINYTDGPVNRSAELDGQTQLDFGNAADFDSSRPFAMSVWIRDNGIEPTTILQKKQGFELSLDEAIPIGNLQRGAKMTFRIGEGIEIETKRRLQNSTWYQVAINYDGSSKASGLKLFIDGKLEDVEIHKDHLSVTVRTAADLQTGKYKGQVDDLRLFNRQLSAEEISDFVNIEPIRATLALLTKKRSKDQLARLNDYYLSNSAPEPLREAWLTLKPLKAEKDALDQAIPTTMVMAEMEKPRESAVLARGDYRNRGDVVVPGVPAALPPLPKDAPLNRLTLAKWLVDPNHPLTARVAVNRYWQLYFGTGLVKTIEDFGSQGEPPSHPALLDWLATEFIRSGWDVKAMQRLIVTSAAYRQASKVSPELQEKDPENRLIARGPRNRLAAESVRDNALAISGLLKERIGGPSVFPYQPKGLWEETAFGDVYSAQSYTPSHGDDLYRRSMYTFWKRTSGPPSMITFDAPEREKCTARRSVTNTPLQALVLLNDPTYVESARFLAERILTDAPNDPGKRIQLAFRLATARVPAPAEMQILRDMEEKQLSVFRHNPDAARKLLAVGEAPANPKFDPAELAAWTTISSTILNLDETVTKQ